MGFVGNLESLIFRHAQIHVDCGLSAELFKSCCFDGLYSNLSPLKATFSATSFSGFHFHLRCHTFPVFVTMCSEEEFHRTFVHSETI